MRLAAARSLRLERRDRRRRPCARIRQARAPAALRPTAAYSRPPARGNMAFMVSISIQARFVAHAPSARPAAAIEPAEAESIRSQQLCQLPGPIMPRSPKTMRIRNPGLFVFLRHRHFSHRLTAGRAGTALAGTTLASPSHAGAALPSRDTVPNLALSPPPGKPLCAVAGDTRIRDGSR